VILVTGATGTVGREVVAQLLAAGEKVRRSPGNATIKTLSVQRAANCSWPSLQFSPAPRRSLERVVRV
jgi:nucleoside-diphosphate-sugar epimerase